METCGVCFRQCRLGEGQRGACHARICRDGVIRPVYYGRLSSLALDPIEKKPLARFYPGSMILSAGSLGCNLRCPFCQNHEIAQAEDGAFSVRTDEVNPEKLVGIAEYCRKQGNIGIAFTYANGNRKRYIVKVIQHDDNILEADNGYFPESTLYFLKIFLLFIISTACWKVSSLSRKTR